MKALPALLLFASAAFGQQETIHLTLQEAEKAALQNNPQVSSARYLAEASKEVPKEYQAAYQPTVFGSVTGAGASDGSRIAAGALNNPIIYNRFASGIGVSQLITDFGRTSNLVDSARYRSKAQEETSRATRSQVLVGVDRAYFAVLRAQSLLNVAQQTVAARQLVADQIGALAKNALKSNLDVSFASAPIWSATNCLAATVCCATSKSRFLAATAAHPLRRIAAGGGQRPRQAGHPAPRRTG